MTTGEMRFRGLYSTNCISLALKNVNAFASAFLNTMEMHAETQNKQPTGCKGDVKLTNIYA